MGYRNNIATISFSEGLTLHKNLPLVTTLSTDVLMECLLLYITLYLLHDSYSQFYKVCYILQWKIDLLENYYLIWFPISWVCRHFLTSPRVATASFLSTINNVSQTYYMSSINNASQKIFLWPLINNKFSNLVKISKCFAFFFLVLIKRMRGWFESTISQRRCSTKKAVLKNFAMFTRKHLLWSLFLIKVQTFRPANLLKWTPTQTFCCEYCERAPILKNICERLLLWVKDFLA